MICRIGHKGPNKKKYTYTDAPKDSNGWIDAKEWLPVEFELCSLKTKSKVYPGWWSGQHWDGHLISNGIEVLFWKKRE